MVLDSSSKGVAFFYAKYYSLERRLCSGNFKSSPNMVLETKQYFVAENMLCLLRLPRFMHKGLLPHEIKAKAPSV